MIIIGYIIILLIVLFGVHMLIMGPIGGFLGKMAESLILGMLLSAIFIWMLINLIWFIFYQENMPVLLFTLAFLLLMVHPQRKLFVTEEMHQIVAGEQWAIVLVTIYTMIDSDTINWI